MYFALDDRVAKLRKFMAYTNVQLSFDSGVATITLNRPDRRNAISFALLEELQVLGVAFVSLAEGIDATKLQAGHKLSRFTEG